MFLCGGDGGCVMQAMLKLVTSGEGTVISFLLLFSPNPIHSYIFQHILYLLILLQGSYSSCSALSHSSLFQLIQTKYLTY